MSKKKSYVYVVVHTALFDKVDITVHKTRGVAKGWVEDQFYDPEDFERLARWEDDEEDEDVLRLVDNDGCTLFVVAKREVQDPFVFHPKRGKKRR